MRQALFISNGTPSGFADDLKDAIRFCEEDGETVIDVKYSSAMAMAENNYHAVYSAVIVYEDNK